MADDKFLYSNEQGQPYQNEEDPRAFDSQMFKFSQFMIEDKSTPKTYEEMANDLEKQFWAFTDKEAALTNLREEDVTPLMNAFDDTVRLYNMHYPQTHYTFEVAQFQRQLRAKFFLKIKRSINGFERKMNVSQIKQNIIEDNAYDKRPSTGVIGRVKSFFGLGS